MSKIEWDGKLSENDLWKLFSSSPETPSETVHFFCDLQPLLKGVKLKDTDRFYQIYEHGSIPAPVFDARLSAVVTQRNLKRVASAIVGRSRNRTVAIKYLGTTPHVGGSAGN